MPPVCVSQVQLEGGLDTKTLVDAFGPNSLGILVVNGLDERYHELRDRVLRSASALASLPEHELAQMEDAQAFWLLGWSRGRERLVDGRPDTYKGSFYVNCSRFTNGRDPAVPEPDLVHDARVQALYSDKQLAGYTTDSVWPEATGKLQTFRQDLEGLCSYIISAAQAVARACDQYAQNEIPEYKAGYLESIVRGSKTTKARLLHYYPGGQDWCSTHRDHSCLTGLTSAMYLDQDQGPDLDLDPTSDCGLYIHSRQGEPVKVNIPKDALAFQTGSALEKVTGGRLKAVPHYVKGLSGSSVARNTLAVFCQPSLEDQVGDQLFGEYALDIARQFH